MLGGAFACAALATLGLLVAVDSGLLDPALSQFASRRLGRSVTFDRLQTHLLSGAPTITITGLKVGNPAWAGTGDFLEADRLRVSFHWPGVLIGRVVASEIEVDRPRLNLLRVSPDRNNWSSGSNGGGGGGFLAPVRRLQVTDGHFVFDDRVGNLHLTGSLVHDERQSASRPLVVAAQGVLKGGEIQISAQGGPLDHRARNAPYPFAATVRDGATEINARGTSDEPAQLAGFDLSVTAHGPNLADMKYLIGVGLPNSAPYRLTAKLLRKGSTTRAAELRALVGQSDFIGSIVSDGSRPRRMIRIDLTSKVLHAADVGAFFADIPPHQFARSFSGAMVRSSARRGRLLTDKAIDLVRFRDRDAKLRITANRFLIGGLSPGRLSTEGSLDHGQFKLHPFAIVFPSGRADGALGLDLTGPKPVFSLDGGVHTAALSLLIPAIARTASGTADIRVHAVGQGGSWREVGMNAHGQIAIRIRSGDIQAVKADVLSGALLRGAFAALANKGGRTSLDCAVLDAGIGQGRIESQRALLVTAAGAAVAQGGIDLASETIGLKIYGRHAGFHLFSKTAPVSITGPMLHPKANIHLLGDGLPHVTPPKTPADRAGFCRQFTAMR